jgi:uncharacterized phiE125 gp8 family phage protein
MITEKAEKNFRSWVVTTAPTSYPVTVDDVKDFARIDGNDEDSIIESFIAAVTENVELYLRRSLITRTIKLTMDQWDKSEIELPLPPLLSVLSVKTIDEDNIETVYDSSNYYCVTESIPGKIVIKKESELPINTERDYSGYIINYQAGYGNATAVPKSIKIAIMQWATMVYENRSMTDNDIKQNEPPPEVKKMLQSFRVIRL